MWETKKKSPPVFIRDPRRVKKVGPFLWEKLVDSNRRGVGGGYRLCWRVPLPPSAGFSGFSWGVFSVFFLSLFFSLGFISSPEPGNWEKTPIRTAGLPDWPGVSENMRGNDSRAWVFRS